VVTAGLVALAAGVAVVIARLSNGGSSTGFPSNRPSVTTGGTTVQASPSLQTLYQVLPHGYDSTSCSPVGNPNRQALATVECGQTSDPRSPTFAAFSLYPNATALANAFQTGVDEDTITQCPNGNRPPTSWHTEAAPNVPAGSLLCGNYDNGADLLWTRNSDLLLGDILGPDLNALYQFWLTL
jgi:serine/threonine kinase PknH